MKTAIDSSVFFCIKKREPGYLSWQMALKKAASEGILVICPVTFAEICPGWISEKQLISDLETLGIYYDPITPEAAFLAGKTHQAYRQEGGPREHLVPDFIIAAHAQVQADRLAAMDRGYLRRYFPTLKLLSLAELA